MAEVEEVTPSGSFDTLPIEALTVIFLYLGKIQRQKLRILNSKCNTVVKVSHGIHLDLTNGTGLSYISLYGNEIKEATLNCFSATLDVNYARTASFLVGLQTLELSEYIFPYNLVTILTSCPNLTTLAFSHNKIMVPDVRDFMNGFTVDDLNLPSLKTLKLKSRDDDDHDQPMLFRFLKEIFFAQQLVNIEIDHSEGFGVMKRMCDPNWTIPEDREHARIFYDIIHSNRNTLKAVTVAGFHGPSDQRTFRLHQPQLNSDDGEWIPQLTELDVLGESYDNEINRLLILNILPHQRYLKTLAFGIDYNYDEGWSFLVQTIAAVNETLQSLSIQYEWEYDCDDKIEPIESEFFRNCHQLNELSIVQDEFLEQGFPELVNLDLLPSTLRILRLQAILVFPNEKFQDVSFENLKNVRKAEFLSKPYFKLGNAKIYQMKMEYLNHLICSMPSLLSLSLSNSEYTIRTMIGKDLVEKITQKTFPDELMTEIDNRRDLHVETSSEVVKLTIL